ncbi:MAG: hypothetical protein J0I57_20210 [Hyphomicrobium sp.]|nr:hypothetical protein [Hyphomicrobium sp.]
MPSRFVSMSGAAALLMSSIAAEAASITNRDTKDVKVTITEGGTTAEQTIPPMGVLDKVCMKGCIVRLNDGEEDEYEVEAEDIVAIEDGFLYYDGPDSPDRPGSGGGASPAPPAAPGPGGPAPSAPAPKN